MNRSGSFATVDGCCLAIDRSDLPTHALVYIALSSVCVTK